MKFFVRISVLIAVAMSMVACGGDGGEDVKPDTAVKTDAWLNVTMAKGYDKSCALMLAAPVGVSYVAAVTEGSEWCLLSGSRLDQISGTMTAEEALQWVYFSENEGDAMRHAKITVTFDNGVEPFELELFQAIKDTEKAYDREWAELPKYRKGYIYNTHMAPLNGKTIRNYTYCLDSTVFASLWVAYPLHTSYTKGSANRNNSMFGFDPDVPEAYQANLYRSYGGRYDRGHQIPAADRKCEQKFMDQTFYSTNMTPQYSAFNQGVWGRLEGSVRDETCQDTLYVVTGAYFGGKHSTTVAQSTTDAAGKTVPTPTHYYKIMLRTVKGNTNMRIGNITDASELKAIGVWLEHNAITESIPESAYVPVKKIEEITGFEFFNMLNELVADKVKGECDPSLWNF